MITPTITMKYKGGPMEKLGELIGARERWLHESYRDATIATAITSLQSIRAATKRFPPKRETVKLKNVKVTVERRGDVHTGHTKEGRRCYRTGPRTKANRRSARIDLGPRCVQLVQPGARAWRSADVYRVTLSEEQHAKWPKQPEKFDVVATTREAVVSYLEKRFGHIAQIESGLARQVLTHCMAALSTRPTKEEVGAAARRNAKRFFDVNIRSGGAIFTVHIASKLDYAVSAVKGGVVGINDALKKAANRIAGMIRHKVGADLTEDLSSPFPEVKRSKSA